MSEPKLGQLISLPSERDAIHVALLPVIASEDLEPGDNIRICDGSPIGTYYVRKAISTWEIIGIVDPFLRLTVKEGQRFWMMMKPGSVDGMRHAWRNSNIDGAVKRDFNHVSIERAIAVDWIANYADSAHDINYYEMMDSAIRWIDHEEYTSDGGKFEGQSVDPKFWDMFEVVVGHSVAPELKGSFFTCSC